MKDASLSLKQSISSALSVLEQPTASPKRNACLRSSSRSGKNDHGERKLPLCRKIKQNKDMK